MGFKDASTWWRIDLPWRISPCTPIPMWRRRAAYRSRPILPSAHGCCESLRNRGTRPSPPLDFGNGRAERAGVIVFAVDLPGAMNALGRLVGDAIHSGRPALRG